VKNEVERDQAKKILGSTTIAVDSREPDFLESKYTLRASHPELYYLDLTEPQAIALNSWSYFGGPMPDVLTASQKQLLPRLKAKLTEHSFPGFIPVRSSRGLEAYRTQGSGNY